MGNFLFLFLSFSHRTSRVSLHYSPLHILFSFLLFLTSRSLCSLVLILFPHLISFLHSPLPLSDEDQRQSLLFNAWTEVQGKEYKLATDPRCSLVLQDLLRATLIASGSSITSPFSKRIGDFFSRCMGQYVNLAVDSLGSRVLETTLTCLHSLFLASVRGKGTQEGEEEESVLPIDVESLILDFCRVGDHISSPFIPSDFVSGSVLQS
jgi:hypothetical protein